MNETADASFDVIFSKDAMIHIADKPAFARECFRVLRPSGWLAISDWRCGEAAFSPEMERWLEITALGFHLEPIAVMAETLREIGFVEVAAIDRNAVDVDRPTGRDAGAVERHAERFTAGK